MKNINYHPIFQCTHDIGSICKPLQKLGINYFCHAKVEKNQFSAINNNPEFAKHYVNNAYYNADLHMAQSNKWGKYIIWDTITRTGKSDQMYQEGMGFGIKRIFTIVQKNKNETNFYHFANNSNNYSFNQFYLANLELLKLFILHFTENVNSSKIISKAYNFKYSLDLNNSAFSLQDEDKIIQNFQKEFITEIQNRSNSKFASQYDFTNRELDCLRLIIQGKTAKEISLVLGLTKRTVEFYLANIRSKLHVSSKSKLIEKVFYLFD